MFKPDNVMIGGDGRPRVMDFGLARAAELSQGTDDAEGPEEGRAGDLRLTRTGAMMGTPLYMAPEQHAGRPADARSDVFAFAVALHQGLYGERPFAGDTLPVLVVNAQRGAVRPPPPGSRVPGWLRRIVLRGLQAAPEARYPSMTALLADLGRDRGVLVRRAMFLGTGALIAGVSAALLVSDPSPCEGGDDPWAADWNDARRAALRAAGGGDGAEIAGHLIANVDAQVAAWSAMRRDACLATHERGEQSPELLDRRMACLDRQRRATTRLLRALAEPQEEGDLERALETSYRLPDVALCGDAAALLGEAPLPADPAARERVGEVRAQVAEAWMLRELGHPRESKGQIDGLLAEIRALAHGPTLTEALYTLANAEVDVGALDPAIAHIDEGARLAAAASDRVAVAALWSLKAFAVGYRLARPEAGLAWADAADALLQPGDPPRRRVAALVSRGLILTTLHDDAGAREAYRAALAIAEAELGPDHPVTGKVIGNLGAVDLYLGEHAAAEAEITRAIAITRETLGPRHSDLGHHLLNLSELARLRGDLPRARAHCEASLQLRRERYGDRHVDVARSLANLAAIEIETGELDAAAGHLAEAMAIQAEVLEPGHPDFIETATHAGRIAAAEGRLDDAEAEYRRAIAVADAALGPESAPSIPARLALAALALARGRAAEARERYAGALAARERAGGPPDAALHEALAGLVRAALVVAPQGALADAERLVALAAAAPLTPAQIAEGKLLLARALVAAEEPARARALLDEVLASALAEGDAIRAEAAALRGRL